MILLGASVRAAAESALRGGIQPWSLDQFVDEDLRATGPASAVGGDPETWLAAFRDAPAVPWMYAGGPENHPRIVGKLAALRPLWGVAGPSLRHVRDPLRLAAVLHQEGWPALPVAPGHQPPSAGEWLRKPRRSGGGFGISRYRAGLIPASPLAPRARRYYFQQRLPVGTPILGATFLMANRQSRLLGVAEQFHGMNSAAMSMDGADAMDMSDIDETGGPAELTFAYRGSISVHPPPRIRASLEQLGDLLARHFLLRGIIGVDVGVHDGHCWLLEVNPRYPASAELFEHDDALFNGFPTNDTPMAAKTGGNQACLARSLVALHAAVWQGQSIDDALRAAKIDPTLLPLGNPELARGKWIVYARSPVVWRPPPISPDSRTIEPHTLTTLAHLVAPSTQSLDSAAGGFLPQLIRTRLADVPATQTNIPANRPVCTWLACGMRKGNADGLLARLRELDARLLRWLADGGFD